MDLVRRSGGWHGLAAGIGLLAAGGCAGPGRPAARAASARPAVERRAFAVPGHGALELTVPEGWVAEVGDRELSEPPTIRLERPGAAFVAFLTPFWNSDEAGEERPYGATAQLFAELARRNALEGAVEEDIPLERLDGRGVRGFWFAATDRTLAGKAPGPEEWRHVLQGAAEVGPLVLAFTLLDDEDGPQRRDLLEIVRAARHVDANGRARPDSPAELDPETPTVPLRVAVGGKSWALLVDLPGFRMFKPRRSDDGTGVLVLGEEPRSGMVASVILRPAGGARSAAGCRDADLARLRHATPGLRGLRLGSAGDAARASYTLGASGGAALRQEHGHAWLEREDVCANVHVSVMAPEAGDEEAMERVLASVRFGEDP